MVQVTDTAFNNLNVKALSLINIKQAIGAVFTTNYTLLLHYGSLTKETVTTFFTFPGAGIENLMETLKLEDHILNIINNKTVFDTNDAKTSFFPMAVWLGAGTFQSSRPNTNSVTAIKFPSILHTINKIKWVIQQLTFRVPGIHSPEPIQAISP